jgi:hypothetical protein
MGFGQDHAVTIALSVGSQQMALTGVFSLDAVGKGQFVNNPQ